MSIKSRLAAKSLTLRYNLYLKYLRRRLKNHDFSLLTNNCVGGVICHNLNMPFLSPTVNLWMPVNDFLCFLNDLPYYLNCPVEEMHEDGISYPIGLLRHGEETVRLYFMHYDSFAQAVEKWSVRAKRVDFNHLYIILDYPANSSSLEQQAQVKKCFDSLPYSHKVMLTKKAGVHGQGIVNLEVYDKDYVPGLILKRKSDFSVKRYLDDFDYVHFLNS